MNKKNRSVRIQVTEEQHTQLHQKAKSTNMTLSHYLRSLGLGYPVESKVEYMALASLNKAIGDFGRLGGLFKLWLSNTKDEWDPQLGGKNRMQIKELVKEIESNKQELLNVARKIIRESNDN